MFRRRVAFEVGGRKNCNSQSYVTKKPKQTALHHGILFLPCLVSKVNSSETGACGLRIQQVQAHVTVPVGRAWWLHNFGNVVGSLDTMGAAQWARWYGGTVVRWHGNKVGTV